MLLPERFKSSAQASKLRRITQTLVSPPIPQEAVVEIVRSVGTDIRGQAGHVVPRYLRAMGHRRRHAYFVTWEEAANVNLVIGSSQQMVVAVARHEMPLRAEVVVQAKRSVVIGLRDGKVGFKSLYIKRIAAAPHLESASRVVNDGRRQVLIPHRLNHRVYPPAARDSERGARIAKSVRILWAGRWRISRTRHKRANHRRTGRVKGWSRVEVDHGTDAVDLGLQQSQLHADCGNVPLDGLDIIPAETLVVGEKVRFPPEDLLWKNRAAN